LGSDGSFHVRQHPEKEGAPRMRCALLVESRSFESSALADLQRHVSTLVVPLYQQGDGFACLLAQLDELFS
jgi:hypothetical protein